MGFQHPEQIFQIRIVSRHPVAFVFVGFFGNRLQAFVNFRCFSARSELLNIVDVCTIVPGLVAIIQKNFVVFDLVFGCFKLPVAIGNNSIETSCQQDIVVYRIVPEQTHFGFCGHRGNAQFVRSEINGKGFSQTQRSEGDHPDNQLPVANLVVGVFAVKEFPVCHGFKNLVDSQCPANNDRFVGMLDADFFKHVGGKPFR